MIFKAETQGLPPKFETIFAPLIIILLLGWKKKRNICVGTRRKRIIIVDYKNIMFNFIIYTQATRVYSPKQPV